MAGRKLSQRKWFYPLVYAGLVVISMLPPLTEAPYDPRATQDVILAILRVSIEPYRAWGWVFHLATLALVGLVIWKPAIAGRVAALYFGVNYLLIAGLQTMATTETYGFAIQTGALVGVALLGLVWLWAAAVGPVQASFQNARPWRWALMPFALLVFWSPMRAAGAGVAPDFNPLLLLTSADYGLAFCFVTPVFLFLLILFHPQVNHFAFRVTAFTGLLYGVFNLTHWFNPALRWLGVMHLPLLVVPLAALLLPVLERGHPAPMNGHERGELKHA